MMDVGVARVEGSEKGKGEVGRMAKSAKIERERRRRLTVHRRTTNADASKIDHQLCDRLGYKKIKALVCWRCTVPED